MIVRDLILVNEIANLLGVSEDTLVAALTSKKAWVQGETLVMHYRMPEVMSFNFILLTLGLLYYHLLLNPFFYLVKHISCQLGTFSFILLGRPSKLAIA